MGGVLFIEFRVANPANMMNSDLPDISAGEPGHLGWGWPIWAVTWVYGWAPSVGVVCGALHELCNCPLDGDFADKLQVDRC